MKDLPNEILHLIFMFTEVLESKGIRLVCKKFNEIYVEYVLMEKVKRSDRNLLIKFLYLLENKRHEHFVAHFIGEYFAIQRIKELKECFGFGYETSKEILKYPSVRDYSIPNSIFFK